MKKLIALALVCVLALSMVLPASAAINEADLIEFRAWNITVSDYKVVVEGALVNNNTRGYAKNFEEIYLELYFEGELIFAGYAKDLNVRVTAGDYKKVKLVFEGDNYAILLVNGKYDVRNLLEADIAFTCWYY